MGNPVLGFFVVGAASTTIDGRYECNCGWLLLLAH